MRLSRTEQGMLNGDRGEAARLAMAVLADLGRAIGAPGMVEIGHVHTDSGFYLGDAGLEFVEHLAGLGGRVAVPTSMNNTTYDIERGAEYGVPVQTMARIKRLESAHLAMGVDPVWTCAPYQDGIRPEPGSRVAWSESNAIVYANSVLGARTNRTGDLVDICCALTGRAPETGLYLDENRLADFHLTMTGFDDQALADERLYPLLGYLIGSRCGNRVAAVSGLGPDVGLDALKGLGAAAASSGATALYHIVGVTPEAPDRAACLKPDAEELSITPADISEMDVLLRTAGGDDLDWVGLGCPHFSEAEFRELVRCLAGRKAAPGIACSVFTSRRIEALVRADGTFDRLARAGFDVYADGCLLLYPQSAAHDGTMMTNSAKAANYVHSQSGFRAVFGSIAECVDSAVAGRVIRRRPAWMA